MKDGNEPCISCVDLWRRKGHIVKTKSGWFGKFPKQAATIWTISMYNRGQFMAAVESAKSWGMLPNGAQWTQWPTVLCLMMYSVLATHVQETPKRDSKRCQ